MKRSSQKASRSFVASWLRSKKAGLIGAVAVVMFLLAGCGEFLSEKATEIEAERTLRGLNRIQAVQDPNISIPEVYKNPPRIIEQIVGGKSEWKLFYFCKYHTSDYLQEIIHKQFATSLFDQKGKETKLVDYTVSSNPATNQLVVRCPAKEDAEAVLEVLKHADIQPIQIKIDCIISEVYADLTIDRETTVLIENLFGEKVSLGGKVVEGTLLPAFPGAALRDIARSRFGLLAGYWRNEGVEGHEVRYLMDILESRGYLKILMNPTLEVVNGKTAKIRAMENVPLQQIFLRDMRSEFYETRTEYHEVIDSLEITPHVFADGYIGLETDVLIGAKSTPEGVKQIPVITEREVNNKENRIRHGESLVIGGIRKTERRAVIRGVPLLKDIPLIGFLFSSKDFEERAKETIFIITPTISTGGIPNEEMIENVRRDHEPFSTEIPHEAITDPFGFEAYKREHERTTFEAEEARMEAEAEKALARSTVRKANLRVEKAQAELKRIEAEAEKIKAEAQKASSEAEAKIKAAEEAQAEADAKAKAAEKAKQEAEAEKVKAVEQQSKAKSEKPEEETTEKATAKDEKTESNA